MDDDKLLERACKAAAFFEQRARSLAERRRRPPVAPFVVQLGEGHLAAWLKWQASLEVA